MEEKEELDFSKEGNEFFKDYIAESGKLSFAKKLFLNIFGKKLVVWGSTDDKLEFLYCRIWRGKVYIMKEESVPKLEQ